jgi:hypothetical protein
MSWTTGLVCGVTLAQLAEVGGCSTRTVSRLLAWAQDVELIVVVETGASATFLGSPTNRAPAYVLVAPPSAHQSTAASAQAGLSAQLTPPVEGNDDLPDSYVGTKPLTGKRRLDHHPGPNTAWPAWQIPATPTERSAAVTTLLARIGLARVPFWRARALLHQWWSAGACVAGLLYAIDHHPDGTARGNALRGAADPLQVIGYRLRPWVNQLHQLPPELVGRHGDYRAEQAAKIAEQVAAAERKRVQQAGQTDRTYSSAEAREAARAALAAILNERARRREAARPPRQVRDSIRPRYTSTAAPARQRGAAQSRTQASPSPG